MLLPRFVVWMFSMATIILGAGVVFGQTRSTGSGQDYPNKPIRIVTAGTGGGSDLTSRLIAQGLTGSLGQQVIVDNRSSGSGVVPGEIVSKAPPDGYTLLVFNNTFWVGPFMQNTPYDPVRDFLPITLATTAPAILVVYPSLPVKSVKELIALAKARPGELNYVSGGAGSANHLAAELFKAMAGVNIVRIPYKSTGVGLSDLIGGQVQLMFSTAPPVMPHVKSGRLTALAVTSADPSELLPGLPTVAASGLPGFETVSITGVFAPAKTPVPIINRLNQEIVRFLKTAAAKETFFNAGANVVASSPEQLAAAIKSDMARMGKVIKDAGIRAD